MKNPVDWWATKNNVLGPFHYKPSLQNPEFKYITFVVTKQKAKQAEEAIALTMKTGTFHHTNVRAQARCSICNKFVKHKSVANGEHIHG